MYKLSYVIRVSADSIDELKCRCDEVKDFYDDPNVKLARPMGDMIGFHNGFIPLISDEDYNGGINQNIIEKNLSPEVLKFKPMVERHAQNTMFKSI